jgi:hypothetical protein
MTGDQQYSEEEARLILGLASRSGLKNDVTTAQLLQIASELGINAEAVEQAELELRATQKQAALDTQEEILRREFMQAEQATFFQHLAIYFATNIMLTVIYVSNYLGKHFWPWILMLGWGIGIVAHACQIILSRTRESVFQVWRQRKLARGQIRSLPHSQNPDHITQVVHSYIQNGGKGKLGAVKLVREATGLNLKASKEAVDEYMIHNPNVLG